MIPHSTTGMPGTRPRHHRRRRAARVRRALQYLVLFTLAVVLVNAVAGERGIVELRRARREYRQVAAAVTALREDNAALQQQARLLREDPDTIEHLARQELGLIRKGEVVVILRDAVPDKARH